MHPEMYVASPVNVLNKSASDRMNSHVIWLYYSLHTSV